MLNDCRMSVKSMLDECKVNAGRVFYRYRARVKLMRGKYNVDVGRV